MSNGARFKQADTYTAQVKLALEHYDRPEVLGHHSPLATPYFLGSTLDSAGNTPDERGRVLANLLEQALETLWGEKLPAEWPAMRVRAAAYDDHRRDVLVLELNYFQRIVRPRPRNQAEIYADILNVSRATHDRYLRRAIDELGRTLLLLIRPGGRREPCPTPVPLVGRTKIRSQTIHLLQEKKCVSLVGAGGMGKTALGAAIADEWKSGAVFWYTLRPGLNDRVESLLFALAGFLNENQPSTLWQQLVADGGRIRDPQLALALLRADLAAADGNPLLVIDEADLLIPIDPEEESHLHRKLVELLDGIRTSAPLLLIGQRAIAADWGAIYQVAELNEEEVARWLDRLRIPLSADDLKRLNEFTGGNPRLLSLSLALYSDRPDSNQPLHMRLPHTPGILPLWRRIRRRLSQSERQFFDGLAVFREAAPADVWRTSSDADTRSDSPLDSLLDRGLVQRDLAGGILLLPALRRIVYTDIPIERREALHADAAEIRMRHAEYTNALYHLVQIGAVEDAVALWYEHREDEIRRGQAAAALAVLKTISAARLAPRWRKRLALLRAELWQMQGAGPAVEAELDELDWSQDDEERIDAALLRGEAQRNQGRPDSALETYRRDGLDVAARLLKKSTQLYVERSLTLLRQRETDAAWREALQARFSAETMQGAVLAQTGDWDGARQHYETALKIATEMDYAAGLSLTHQRLGIYEGRSGNLDAAIPHFERAITYAKQVGDQVGLNTIRSNLAGAYIQANEYRAALKPAHEALRFFTRIEDPFRIAQNASNLAEALCELDELDSAEEYARLVFEQEEPHSHAYALFTLGRVRRKQNREGDAEALFRQCQALAERNEDRYMLGYAWRALGELYAANGREDEAQKALNLAEEILGEL